MGNHLRLEEREREGEEARLTMKVEDTSTGHGDGVQQFITVVQPIKVGGPVAQGQEYCCCAVPADAPQEVKQTRISAIVVIVTHSLAFFMIDGLFLCQWIASLCGIIAGGVLLCSYQKGVYTCGAVSFVIAAIFDIVMSISWLYYGGWPAGFFVMAAAAAITASVCGFKACCGWDNAAIIEQAGPVVSTQPASYYQRTGDTVSHMPQMAGTTEVHAPQTAVPLPPYGQV